jgi:glycerol-3-phosphate O-acyltransferase 3/4
VLPSSCSTSDSFSFLNGAPSALEQERIQSSIETVFLANLRTQNAAKEAERNAAEEATKGEVKPKAAFDLNDLIGFFKGGMDTIIQDEFSRCFESARSQPWNWNIYLWPLWVCGVVVRYVILFPIRLISLLLGFTFALIMLPILKSLPLPEATRTSLQRKLIRFLCGVFVFSWTGVIKYHGTLPQKKPGQIYVANHTSMIDVIVLSQMNTFSLVGQKHPGWIGFIQTHVLGIVGCVWFNRGEASDRTKSAQKMRDHIHDPNSNRLLVFPEGQPTIAGCSWPNQRERKCA